MACNFSAAVLLIFNAIVKLKKKAVFCLQSYGMYREKTWKLKRHLGKNLNILLKILAKTRDMQLLNIFVHYFKFHGRLQNRQFLFAMSKKTNIFELLRNNQNVRFSRLDFVHRTCYSVKAVNFAPFMHYVTVG